MPGQPGYVMIVVAAPDEVAPKLARLLVESCVAACAQVTSPVTSTYFWEGAVCEDREVLIFVKSKAEKIPAIKKIVLGNHPYKVPEIIVLPIVDGHDAYLDWIDAVVNRKPKIV